jgi:autotransporter-associated beta strand protein
MSVSGVVNITGGSNQHFNLLTLSGATIKTSGSSTAADGQANYALDSATTTVGGTAHSTLAASIGIHLNASPTFNVASTGDAVGDLIISGNLRDAEGNAPSGLTKIGLGEMVLSGFSTFTGGLNVNSGIIKLDAPGSFAIAAACPVVVASGAELDLNQTDNMHDSPTTVSGVVNITGGGDQHLNLLSLNGAIIKTSGSSFASDGQANYALDSAVTNVVGTVHSTLSASIGIELNASPTFNVASTGDPAGDLVITGRLRDAENGAPRGLTKAGAGTMVLTSGSTYTGTTTISGGTLTTTSTGSIGSGPLVVSAADSVASALNLGANQTVSSLSGTISGSGTARIGVGSGVTLTVNQTTDTTYAGAVTLAAGVIAGRGGALVKPNSGTLEIQGASSFANNSFVEIDGGKLRFNVSVGSASVGTGTVALVDNSAVLELAGSVSALSLGNHGVDVLNNSSAAAGILVTGTNQRVGGIDGSGSTQVNAGSDLTASHIVQTALVIGGTMGSPSLVTIAPSDHNGNPLAAPLSGLNTTGEFLSNGLDADGGLASLRGGVMASDIGSEPVGELSAASSPSPAPEPSTVIMLLVAVAGLSVFSRTRRRHVN